MTEPAYVLDAIEALKPSDHLCCIYETEAQHRSVMTAFLRQGLERDEKVLYIIDEHEAETIVRYLEDDGMDVHACLDRGQLKILTQDDTYVRDGLFDPDGMISLLEEETRGALDEGYTALRVTGEMSWALHGLPGSERLIEYEIKLNTFFPGKRCMALCQYDRRRFSPEILLDVLRTHPIAVVGTEVYDNFYYTPPQEMLGDGLARATLSRWIDNLSERKRTEEKLAEYREHLEVLVKARTCELAEVNQHLREEIAQRKRVEESLRHSHKRFVTVMDSLEQLVYVADMDTYEVLFLNKYGRDVWGDIVGHRCWQALQKGQGGPCDFCTNDKLLNANGEPRGVYRWEFRNTITGRWYDVCDRAIPWTDGRIVRLEVAIDITERKEAEVILYEMHRELEAQTAELEAANAELSQYAYVVSHDLRAPLRAIRNYADFIREDLQDTAPGDDTPCTYGLDEDMRLYLNGLNRAVDEADALVQDLLALSRIGRKRRPLQSVDVGDFLRRLIASLDMRNVDIVMPDQWPVIEVEPTLLGQIFQNLIDNAIKFNRASPKRVELGWRVVDAPADVGAPTSAGAPIDVDVPVVYEFFVRDNGIGIDPRYHEQIFQVFERLHTPDEYEGTGAGLAIVKKAVEQLGGRVRLESALGYGATFYFTLPETAR